MRWLFSFFLLWIAGVVSASSASGNRLLVVLEETSEKEKYSELCKDLEGRGYIISFVSPKTDSLSLFHLGERAYDHVLLLPPKAKAYGPALTPNALLEFIKAEGNILLGLSANSNTPNTISSLLLELDIQVPPGRGSVVIDHFSHDEKTAGEQHDVILVSPPEALRGDLKNFFAGQHPIVIPRAVPQTISNASPLLVPILRAPSTAYVYNPKDDADMAEDLFASGSQITIVSAMQARNSARFTVLGSVEALQNEWFKATVKFDGKNTKTGNEEFARQLTGWTFKELGVLKVGRLQHHLNEGENKDKHESAYPLSELNPTIYRIKNDVKYTIELAEWATDRWAPFTPASGDNVQLEFSMLSPFHRLNLTAVDQTSNSTLYSASFTLPDQHGIFNFRVNYKRPFLTTIDEKRQVTVRHFAHDEWPRSWAITGAWPWIAGIFGVISGWVMFVGVWLYSEPVQQQGAGLKKRQ